MVKIAEGEKEKIKNIAKEMHNLFKHNNWVWKDHEGRAYKPSEKQIEKTIRHLIGDIDEIGVKHGAKRVATGRIYVDRGDMSADIKEEELGDWKVEGRLEIGIEFSVGDDDVHYFYTPTKDQIKKPKNMNIRLNRGGGGKKRLNRKRNIEIKK